MEQTNGEQVWHQFRNAAVKFGHFDPLGQLFAHGAHAPLITYFQGVQGRRTDEGLRHKEEVSITRGQGPGSVNARARSAANTRKGKGKAAQQ